MDPVSGMAEFYAEGMEAAACGLLMKECEYPKNSKRAEEWREGYREAYRHLLPDG